VRWRVGGTTGLASVDIGVQSAEIENVYVIIRALILGC
jgi:hypothetical protein